MNFPLDSGSFIILLAGVLFGYFIESAGLNSPRKLTAQFALRDWTVFRVMFTAIVVAAIGLWLFDVAGWLRFDALKVPTMFFWAMALGGAMLGAGMAIGGYCPGTSVVALFSGRLDAVFFMLGMMIGMVEETVLPQSRSMVGMRSSSSDISCRNTSSNFSRFSTR